MPYLWPAHLTFCATSDQLERREDPDRLSEKELAIVVSKEMISAGASVLCRMDTTMAREDFWAGQVYRVMAALAQNDENAKAK